MWWRKSGPKKLSGNILWALKSQFDVDSQLVSRLRYLDKSGRLAGSPVHFLRIVDPTLLTDGATVLTYDDLDNYKDALLFEGESGKDGFGKWYAILNQTDGPHPRFHTKSAH